MPRHIDKVDKTQSSASPLTETREHTPLPGAGIRKRIGQYSIKRAIASGGMGTVYEAVQEKPRRTVDTKLMRAEIARAPPNHRSMLSPLRRRPRRFPSRHSIERCSEFSYDIRSGSFTGSSWEGRFFAQHT